MSMHTLSGEMQDVRYEVPSYGVVACFLTNLIFVASGSGFLNFPFVVWHSGVVYLLVTIAVFAFLSTATSMWVLETLARTEVSHYPISAVTSFEFPLLVSSLVSTSRRGRSQSPIIILL